MQQDDVTWNIMSKQFCCFQVKTQTQNFCRNEYNLTGFCSKRACSIANSQYATVREENGIIFLYMKMAERNPFPAKHWEKVRLSRNYAKAIYQIHENLLFCDHWVLNKCKQRFKKISQYLIRTRRLRLRRQKMLVPLVTKIERREQRREEKALVAACIENKIEKELMERLKMGMYSDVYNYSSTAFEQALVPEELDEDCEMNEELEEVQELEQEYVEDYNSDMESESGVSKRTQMDSDFESDDCLDIEESLSKISLVMAKSESKADGFTSARAAKKRKTTKLEFEYELEAGPSKSKRVRD
uniref:Protein MAK16 homolog n=1 Tax=Anopheles funestus TaxID=62324 RepID=A0A182R6L6_ANOFN